MFRLMGIFTILFAISVMPALGEFSKIDVRSRLEPNEYYLLLCSSTSPKTMFLAGISGNSALGYKWTFSYGQVYKTRQPQWTTIPLSILQSCADQAFGANSSAMTIAVDKSVYMIASRLLLSNIPDPNRIVGALKEVGLKVNLGSDQDISSKIGSIMEDNSLPTDQLRLAEDWQPPSILSSTPAAPAVAFCDPDAISTDLKDVPCARRGAVMKFYQALADAEARPWNHYDIELIFSHRVFVDVIVAPTAMRREPPSKSGRSACVFFVSDGGSNSLEPVSAIDELLMLPAKKVGELGTLFGFPGSHPLLGEPRSWIAASTSTAACYWAIGGAGSFAEAPVLRRAQFAAAVVRTAFPRYPKDKSVFNSGAPLSLPSALNTDPDVSYHESKWIRYKATIDHLTRVIAVRSDAFAGLSSQAIQERRRYRRNITTASADNLAFREDFSTRELGWNEYRNNQNFETRRIALESYDKGLATIYAAASENAKASHWAFDLTPRINSQIDAYKVFANVSTVNRLSASGKFDSTLLPTGSMCQDSEGACGHTYSVATLQSALEFSFNGITQQKFNNILSVGLLTRAPSSSGLESVFGPVPAYSVCQDKAPPQVPMLTGPREYRIHVTNRSGRTKFRLIYAGSRVIASWMAPNDQAVSELELEEGGGADVDIRLFPSSGYEDLNIIYFMAGSLPAATLTIDYSDSDDPVFRKIDFDSGQFASAVGAGISDFYSIGTGPAPVPYTLRRACVWLSGDRHCNEYSSCKLSQADDGAALAVFAMVGHNDDKDNPWRWSEAHFRAVYEIVGTNVVLH